MEFKPKAKQSRQASNSLLRVNRQGLTAQRSLGPDLSARSASLLPNPHVTSRQLHLQRSERQLTDFTLIPVTAQRQALAPVFEGLQLQRDLLSLDGPVSHRQSLQRQIGEHQTQLNSSQLQAGQYEAAVQRQADLQTPAAPLSQRPSTPAQWSQGGQWEVQRVADPSKLGHTISLREQEQAQHLGVLRTVGVQLGQGFRSDTGPAVQRYEHYGEALAPFQRMGTGTGRAVVTTALMQVPASQRSALQRAIDDTVQRQQAQETQDRAIIQLHSLQRQLEHLDGQPEQPLMERIQARRGSGNPLPTALRRALELNHDLSRVRLHDDAEADTLAKKVNAVAFTTGQDIFFRAGTFNPNTRTGVELIAHEVTHTKQQAQGKAKPGIDGDAGQEHDARSFGSQFAAGYLVGATAQLSQAKRLTPTGTPSSSRGTFQRRAAPAKTYPIKLASDSIDRPKPGINEVGFIRKADGADLHNAPYLTPGKRDPAAKNLAPGTKVFVSGTHPKHTDWYYVTATLAGQMTRGYVQQGRVTTNLPEPSATFYFVKKDNETLRPLAGSIYHKDVQPGRDLRFYEQTVLFLSRQAGLGGAYWEDGKTTLDWRGLHQTNGSVKLKMGEFVWLPSPAFANTLAGKVGSGSITGGLVAQSKDRAHRLVDVLASITQSPQHLGKVGKVYADAISSQIGQIIGAMAIFMAAEGLSAFLAGTPTGIGQLAGAAIQLGLSYWAAKGAAEAIQAALPFAQTWLTTAWHAGGDAKKIAVASENFLYMVVQIALAAMALTGSKGNIDKGLKMVQNIKTPPRLGAAVMVTTNGQRVRVPIFDPGTATATLGGSPNLMSAVGGAGGRVNPKKQAYDQQQSQARNAKYKYEPKKRTDAQLQQDVNPKLRAGETSAQAQQRVQSAQTEIMVRQKMGGFGIKPWRPNLAENDAIPRTSVPAGKEPHTIDRHGWNMTLQDLKDRVMGTGRWPKAESYSYRWLDEGTANRTIQEHISANWGKIKRELAEKGRYVDSWDTGSRVGVGYFNKNHSFTGPRLPIYGETSWVTLTILLDSSGKPYIITAFPKGGFR